MKKFNEWFRKNKKENQIEELNKTDIVYEDLAPNTDIDEKDKPYLTALEWALKNNNIKNIAVTGPYGSGKSSILRKFEKSNEVNNYLNISLASFSSGNNNEAEDKAEDKVEDKVEDKEKDKDDTGNTMNKLIESSILQQIFYKVDEKKIPYSRFRRIKNISKREVVTGATLAAFWLAALYVISKQEKNLSLKLFSDLYNFNNTSLIAAGIIFSMGILLILIEVVKKMPNFKINKISFQGGEAEIFNSETSILNKHLDEILYFFEENEYNVVVFEDLDRFENTDIFIKLREINNLLNNSENIKKSSKFNKITFIYALKDDMFCNKHRTKFFDFMIPIVPIINSSNSREIISDKSKKLGNGILTKEFIDDISFYIDDMRMLKNIFNEFALYKDTLGEHIKNGDKLFSMIVYKNIYPKDFSELHDNNGMVYKVFDNKKEFIKKIVTDKRKEIDEKKTKIDEVKNEFLINNIKELRSIYIYKLRELLPASTDCIILNNTNIEFKELLEDEKFSILKEINTCKNRYYKYNYNNHSYNQQSEVINIEFDKIQNAVNKEYTYDEREQLIKDKANNRINELIEEINKLEEYIKDLKITTLNGILKMDGTETIFDEEIKKHKLLVFLLRRGYIDEIYHKYISYFFEGGISRSDLNFIMSLKNNEELDYEYKLDNSEEVIKQVNINDLDTNAIFNLDLFRYCIENNEDKISERYYNKVIERIKKQDKKAIDFFFRCLKEEPEKKLLDDLCLKVDKLWEILETRINLSIEEKEKIMIELIDKVELINLRKIYNDSLRKYLIEKENIVELYSNRKDWYKMADVIIDNKIKFRNVNFGDDRVSKSIYENEFYEINETNIMAIIEVFGKNYNQKTEDKAFKNYTTIVTQTDKLKRYIESNIKTYIDKVFLKLASEQDDKEEYILNLISLLDGDNEYIEKVLLKEKMIFKDITIFEEYIWDVLLRLNKIEVNWNNIFKYYEKIDLSESLIKFLNNEKNYKKLAEKQIKVECQIKLNGITNFDESMKENSKTNMFGNFLKRISIDNKVNIETFKEIIKGYKGFTYRYTFNNIEDLSETSEGKILALIDMNILNLELKNLKFLKENYNELDIYMITKNLQKYLEFPIEQIEISDLEKVVESADEKVFENLKLIMGSKTILIQDKINILNIKVDVLVMEQIDEILKIFGEPFSTLSILNKRPKLELTDENRGLVNKLKEIKYISSFKENDKFIEIINKKNNALKNKNS